MFLKYSEMWDMDLGGEPSENEIPHWFGNAAYVVVGGLCKLLFRYRVDNRDKLRAFQGAEGALVICNHTSFFDVVFMYLAARPKQWVRLMGRDSLFDNAHGLLGQALSRVGAFPVKRDTADMTSIKRAVRMLKAPGARGYSAQRARAAARPTGCPPTTPRVGNRPHGEGAHPAHDRARCGAHQAEGPACPFPEGDRRLRRSHSRRRFRLPAEGRARGSLHLVRHARVLRAVLPLRSRGRGHGGVVPRDARLRPGVCRAPHPAPHERGAGPRRPHRPRREAAKAAAKAKES